jgi:hypothetical protein
MNTGNKCDNLKGRKASFPNSLGWFGLGAHLFMIFTQIFCIRLTQGILSWRANTDTVSRHFKTKNECSCFFMYILAEFTVSLDHQLYTVTPDF